MQFNSMPFWLFFVVCLVAYYGCPFRWRWAILLGASYYFYACWSVHYVALLLISTCVDYGVGLGLEKTRQKGARIGLLLLSLGCNLGLLCWFKYFNFLSGSVQALVDAFGGTAKLPIMTALLPIGISFYSFKTLSYVFEVFRGTRPAERHWGHYAAYVSFFPQLLMGPIARAAHMLPQFERAHRLDYDDVACGLRLVLLGLFKKLVVADRLGIYVDSVFNNVHYHEESTTFLLATYFFAFQIYCDFSGYSDVAIGISRLLGFDVLANFRTPYFSKSVGEFWRRWHISLSTWFRDYLYIPLGGSRVALGWRCANVMVVFVVSGLWHGANWTFVVWGALHGLYLAASVLRASISDRYPMLRGWPASGKIRTAIQIFITFQLTSLAWIFFRANSLSDAWYAIQTACTGRLAMPYIGNTSHFVYGVAGVGLLLLFDAWVRESDPAERIGTLRMPIRWGLYLGAAAIILLIGVFDGGQFIYQQF